MKNNELNQKEDIDIQYGTIAGKRIIKVSSFEGRVFMMLSANIENPKTPEELLEEFTKIRDEFKPISNNIK